MLPLLERLEVDPGECCCCCCGLDDGEVATTVVVDGAPEDGGAAEDGRGADVVGAPAAMAPPLLTGNCIVTDVAAVTSGSVPLPTVSLLVFLLSG